MRRRTVVFLVALLVALSACGASREEQARFREMCREAGGYVLQVHDLDAFKLRFECFTGLTMLELEGWEK